MWMCISIDLSSPIKCYIITIFIMNVEQWFVSKNKFMLDPWKSSILTPLISEYKSIIIWNHVLRFGTAINNYIIKYWNLSYLLHLGIRATSTEKRTKINWAEANEHFYCHHWTKCDIHIQFSSQFYCLSINGMCGVCWKWHRANRFVWNVFWFVILSILA